MINLGLGGAGVRLAAASSTDLGSTVLADFEHEQVDAAAATKNFNPSNLIKGDGESACYYVRGCYTIGKHISGSVEDSIRRTTERLDFLVGFAIFGSLEGGTGSGLLGLLQDRIAVNYPKKLQVNVTVQPALMSNTVVSPYNYILGHSHITEHSDLHIVFDNTTVGKWLAREGQSQVSYGDINRVIARTIRPVIDPLVVRDDALNLVPYQNVNSVIPLRCQLGASLQKQFKDSQQLCLFPGHRPGVSYVLSSLFSYESNNLHGGFLYPQLVHSTSRIRDKYLKCVSWNPCGTKLVTTEGKTEGCSVLLNSECYKTMVDRQIEHSSRMYAKRSHYHWYVGEGIDDGFFTQSLERAACLSKDYQFLN